MTKTNKMTVRPAKTQINLGICPVWSESWLCTQWVAKDPSFLHADSEDWSDWADAHADLSLRWAHIPVCWFCHETAHIRYTWNQKQLTILLSMNSGNIHSALNVHDNIGPIHSQTSPVPVLPVEGKCAIFYLSQSMKKIPTKWHVCPAKTQISLGIHPVWPVFAVRLKEVWVVPSSKSAQRRLCSDWVRVQTDLSLQWAHRLFCWFCHAQAHF